MTSTTRTSELEAVNTMLSAVGSSPVSSLAAASVDVIMAKSVLDEVLREVLNTGWKFNTEFEVEITADGGGVMTPAANVVALDVEDNQTYDIVLRGATLYDLKEKTGVFPVGLVLKATVVYLLTFDEVSQAARNFIMIKSARRFQARMKGSVEHHKFSQSDEITALTVLRKRDGMSADFNILTGSDIGRKVSGRRSVASRISRR